MKRFESYLALLSWTIKAPIKGEFSACHFFCDSKLDKREPLSNCLGADDCAGIYAALRMIEADVKVSFIFHRDEESGGRGSSWLAKHYAAWLGTFDVCLALDRRGTQDVIVSQSGGKCASDEFAVGLAAQLDMGHQAADGIFTDSANYTDLISECSNLSIGYRNEHSISETLDLNYLEAVIQRLIKIDWNPLPVVRKPGDDGWTTGFGRWGESWFTNSSGNSSGIECDICTLEMIEGEGQYVDGCLVCKECLEEYAEEDRPQDQDHSQDFFRGILQ